jgi:hypothetical protein
MQQEKNLMRSHIIAFSEGYWWRPEAPKGTIENASVNEQS